MEDCTTTDGTPAEVRFGTDGWRAVMAEGSTFANVRRVSRAAAARWLESPPEGSRRRVVVGGDRRFLSPEFAASTAEEFAAAGFEVLLADRPIPTPAVSLAVKRFRAAGGVMITASHNPPQFNGYKLKASYGGPADDELAREIESRLEPDAPRPSPAPGSRPAGSVRSVDLLQPYVDVIRSRMDWSLLRRAGLRIAHDAMHGTGAGVVAAVLQGTTCRVTNLRAARDPLFGGVNPEPIARNYAATSKWLRAHPQDVCLVTDGDADRLGLMDGRGRALTTHQAIVLVLHHLIRNRGERGRLVTTPNTTSLVHKIAAAEGLPVAEVPIGFKHLCREMLRGDVLAGVEESGSIGLGRHLPERDGILAGVMLLELLARERRSLGRLWSGLVREFGPHHYSRWDIPVTAGQGERIRSWCASHPPARLARSTVVSVQTLDGVKFTAADGSWLMIRPSGTEPVARIYVEGPSEDRLPRLLGQGRRILRDAGVG